MVESVEDMSLYSLDSGLFDFAILLMLSSSGCCSRCALEISIFDLSVLDVL